MSVKEPPVPVLGDVRIKKLPVPVFEKRKNQKTTGSGFNFRKIKKSAVFMNESTPKKKKKTKPNSYKFIIIF
jgi:hypothetical protein